MHGEKDAKYTLQIIFSTILFTLCLVAEIYAAINFPTQYIFVGVFAVLLILFIYWTLQSLFSLRRMQQKRREEEYSNIIKSEKASYLLLKKYFEQIDKKLDLLMISSKVPIDEIVNVQKAVGKIIMKRNRENTEAMMNSNDLVFEKLDEIISSMESNNDKVLEGNKNNFSENISQVILKQSEISNEMKEMELRLNQAIMQLQQTINGKQVNLTTRVEIPQMPAAMMPVQMAAPAEQTPEEQVPAIQPMEMQEPPVAEEPGLEEEPVLVEEPVLAEEPILVDEAPEPEEIPIVDNTSDPNKKMEPDEIEALLASLTADQPADQSPEEELEEASLEVSLENNKDEELIEDIFVDDFAAEEVSAEETAPALDLSDPNKKMDPDDIAALIASMGVDTPETSDTIATDEPELEDNLREEAEAPKAEAVEAEAPEEETPPMPDLSDPNKVMSPEEIAALIANM